MALRLVDYSSDEEPSTEEISIAKCHSCKTEVKDTLKAEAESLPLPFKILDMFSNNVQDKYMEDPSKHGGKIRSFPHERGVWATHVFVEYAPSAEFWAMINQFQEILKNHVIIDSHASFHISLSKTVKLRHHFISPFVEALKISLETSYRFQLILDSLEVYENEEKTRTFLGLKVHSGHAELNELTKKVNSCLAEFQLPGFYKDPSFHLSCASCVGSKLQTMQYCMADLNIAFQLFVKNNPLFRMIDVSTINCRSGNKLFTISLKN